MIKMNATDYPMMVYVHAWNCVRSSCKHRNFHEQDRDKKPPTLYCGRCGKATRVSPERIDQSDSYVD